MSNIKITQIEKREGLYELTPEIEKELENSHHYNKDLAPTQVNERTWKTKDIADFWLGLSVSIPALALASSLVSLGVSPLLSLINVILGNLLVLIPIQLNSHVGTKYGIPYPIFARMTFGTQGAQLSTISRSIIGCGWTSVQSWVGGGALAALIGIIIPFFSPFVAFLASIPACVMGGVCVALYGFIAVSGLKMIQKVDLDKNRNLFVTSIILIAGIGGMTLTFGKVTLTSVACALILGIIANIVLAKEKKD